jgi:DNA-binding NtrC family response regulator
MAPQLLIVDDEPDMLTLLKRSLEPDLECRVDTASSGETALGMIQDGDYDLVLADIKMPGISGLDLLEQVKAEHDEITVVMMTTVISACSPLTCSSKQSPLTPHILISASTK